ncbi:dinucleotide-utilizing enzyme involved in molybdopterin and thiamine biosynthesis family 2 [Enterocytozoon bieneusi H348]|nr:dinucleotide-utilizing enzyme involved in molybdopterin and thiamine biosynthesis family 2 [Enterocytozoon bieneusi H348]|eukprot:XP_002650193.1 dinucleotide-utilizing enzyme involved in molybdopterin and thiamine biosynthesis family 2 [Enterocytozoon bieneusi H348]
MNVLSSSISATSPICVIGCGGTGSELIKLLYNTYSNITIVDNDSIALSNLCRQFFYTPIDIGKSKAKILGEKLGIKHHVSSFENLEAGFLNAFEIVFSCVDNIATRMEINFQFIRSQAKILIDMGVDDFKCHVKKVSAQSACLYCIRDLYSENETLNLCMLKSIQNVNHSNRIQILKSIVFENKDTKTNNELVNIFNNLVQKPDLFTTEFEIAQYVDNIIPNTSCINSICASLAVCCLYNLEHDFYFYNGHNCYLLKEKIIKEDNCIACNYDNGTYMSLSQQ